MAILNVVASNTGDAAILAGLLQVVDSAFGANHAAVIYESQPEVVAQLYPELRFRRSGHVVLAAMAGSGRLGGGRRRLNRSRLLAAARLRAHGLGGAGDRLLRPAERVYLAELASHDLLLSTGGTYLVEHYDIWARLLELELVAALRLPLVLFTQSLGPFKTGPNQRQVRAIVRGARLVLVRDERSRANLDRIGARTDRVLVRPDAAFVFADARRFSHRPPATGRVAFSVREWSHHRDGARGMERYLDAVAAACRAVVQRGREIVFISTCQGVPEYSADDSHCAVRVLERLDRTTRDRCRVNATFHTPAALCVELAAFDALVSTRMHAAILALGVGVPVLPIAYEFKTRELFARLGLEQWVTDIEDVDPQSFARLVNRFLDELPDTAGMMCDPVLAERAAAIDVASDLRRAVH